MVAIHLVGSTALAQITEDEDSLPLSDGPNKTKKRPAEEESVAKWGLAFSAYGQWGTSVEPDLTERPQPSAFGPGLGLRAGYTFAFGLYTGSMLHFYFGESVEDQSDTSVQLVGELGYDITPFDIFHVRPFVGLGWHQVQGDIGSPYSSFVFMPGLVMDLDLRRWLFLSADIHVVLPTEVIELSEKAVAFALGAGVKL
ncbi:MAG: hypothetical protein KTR25_17145 [Myxococcales bacterium]|nr:hypothetical protein [Myxococcales bacterium]